MTMLLRKRGRLLLYLIIFACAWTLSGCLPSLSPIGMPLPRETRFENEWENYSRLSDNKALAIAGDTNRFYVSGYAFGQATELGAIEAALRACDARRIDRRIDEPCRTYAVGTRTVATIQAQHTAVR